MVDKVLFAHDNTEWITPKWLFKELDDEFHFRLDAATTEDNPLGTTFYCDKKINGLLQSWVGPVYCNPPYGRDVHLWLEKATIESWKGIVTVMLLPARTDTKWFHDYVYNKPGVEIRFLKGRLKFNDGEDSAPFPSMVVIFHSRI